MSNRRLRVPGQWLRACGLGDVDRILPVVRVIHGPTWTVVDVLLGHREWTVIPSLRGAWLVGEGKCRALVGSYDAANNAFRCVDVYPWSLSELGIQCMRVQMLSRDRSEPDTDARAVGMDAFWMTFGLIVIGRGGRS